MESYETELPNYDSAVVFAADEVPYDGHPVVAVLDADEISFELGVWLAGLMAFPRACSDAFRDRNEGGVLDRSWEFRIFMTGLKRCSTLAILLRKLIDEDSERSGAGSLSVRDVDQLSEQLRSLLVLNHRVARSSRSSNLAEWRSWCIAVEQQLGNSGAVGRLAAHVRTSGQGLLPNELASLFSKNEIAYGDRADLDEVSSRIGVILRSLEIVDRLQRNRHPLKESLLIFAAVHEQTKDLLGFINNRLTRFPDEQDPLFNLLDSASYGTSLELKKVFRQELRGIVQLVPPPAVQARVETAYSLMLDSFQQMLVELARIVEPEASPADFFPRYREKREQSIELRKQLWTVFRKVQLSEGEPTKANVNDLRKALRGFTEEAVRYLHFKDQETVERFNEEVHAARDKKDLVPVLHRFGAYLETLLGQISMRAVLAGHPLEEQN